MNISHKLWMLVALLAGLVLSPAPSATAAENSTQLTGADREYRNTLLALGDRQLKSGQMNEALDTFTQLLERFRNLERARRQRSLIPTMDRPTAS